MLVVLRARSFVTVPFTDDESGWGVVQKVPILGNTDELSRTAGSAAEF
jgi:hypothetical protein